jgi:hypothetical protein
VSLQKVDDALAPLGRHQGWGTGFGQGVHGRQKFNGGEIMVMMPQTRIRVIDNDRLWLIMI